jgi:hypothetical protein
VDLVIDMKAEGAHMVLWGNIEETKNTQYAKWMC